jgi:4-amino-4-deoxy-L-arabinose transferase-like glycosyltransferase
MTNQANRNHSLFLIGGLIVLYILSALLNLGLFNLQGEEPRRAIISVEMNESGNYIIPHALGWEYYNKPPLFNWILAGFMTLTGSESEFVCRLPSLLFLLLWAACHYILCRKLLTPKYSLLSTFFLLTSADIYFYGLANGAEIDIFYSLIVYLQAMAMFWFYEEKKWWPLFLLSYFFCAIGFLTKGLPSLLFQGLTLAALCVHARSLRLFFKPHHLAGIVLFVLITGTYFYSYSKSGDPAIMLVNIVNESLKKSAVGEESVGRLYKIASYPGLLFKLLAPWCLVLLLLFKGKRWKLFDNALVKFSFLFIVFNIGVYWITGIAKLRYIYMFVPFFMIIFVHLYRQFEQRHPGLVNKYLKYLGFIFILLLASILVLPFFVKVDLWITLGAAVILAFFLIAYFKRNDNRVWFFVSAIVLIRLIYAAIGIPLQQKGMFDYRPMMESVVQGSGGQQVRFYLPPDTLNLDIRAGATLYKWKKSAVVVPPFLIHQIPYYYYRFSGQVMQYDTVLKPGNTYISYKSHVDSASLDILETAYDKRARDTLILFRIGGK